MTYFYISTGLRGCYMPDQSYVAAVRTRRELKELIFDTADQQAGGEGFGHVVGLSKRAIASFAAECWRRRKDKTWTMDMALAWNYRNQIAQGCYGIFVSRSTRQDYLNQSEDA